MFTFKAHIENFSPFHHSCPLIFYIYTPTRYNNGRIHNIVCTANIFRNDLSNHLLTLPTHKKNYKQTVDTLYLNAYSGDTDEGSFVQFKT